MLAMGRILQREIAMDDKCNHLKCCPECAAFLARLYWVMDDACSVMDHHKIGDTLPMVLEQNAICLVLGIKGVPERD